MRKFLSAVVILAVLCGPALHPALSQTPPASRTPDPYADRLRAFEEFVRTQMERDRIPGMTIGFFKVAGEWERPVVYFKRAFDANPRGEMRAATFLDDGQGGRIRCW